MSKSLFDLREHSYVYAKYFVIGSIVGVLSMVIREVVGALLPADTPVFYTLSVVIAYITAILASYYGHRKFTFSHKQPVGGTVKSLSRFSVIAITGLLATTALSVALRYGLPFDEILGKYGATAAFGTSGVIVSVLSYSLNARFTFQSAQAKDDARKCDAD